MLFLEIVLFLAAGIGAGYLFARFAPLGQRADGPRADEVRDLRIERDRLRADLDEARREAATSDAVDARVEHLKSAVHAAKRRIAELEEELQEAQRMIVVVSSGAAAGERTAGLPPARLEQPDGPADDLKRITGIGPSIERKLNEMGIFHYWQIAALDEPNVAWLERHLPIRGRIQRQDWIGQAKTLLGGRLVEGTTVEVEAAP